MKTPAVIVSACLLGLKTRYDGKDALDPALLKALEGKCIIPICPEQLGGLPTPRPRAEISSGDGRDVLDGKARVVDENGNDVTGRFLNGAEEVLEIARLTGAPEAFLKEKSPSCGVSSISRKNNTVKGRGVTGAALERAGIKVNGI